MCHHAKSKGKASFQSCSQEKATWTTQTLPTICQVGIGKYISQAHLSEASLKISASKQNHKMLGFRGANL